MGDFVEAFRDFVGEGVRWRPEGVEELRNVLTPKGEIPEWH